MDTSLTDLCRLGDWLSLVDPLPLECDGATRLVSALLVREGLDHEIQIGRLTVPERGIIPHHWWIVLPHGAHIDVRARLWLGEHCDVPHGVFLNGPAQGYCAQASLLPEAIALPAHLYPYLAGVTLEDLPRLAQAGRSQVNQAGPGITGSRGRG